MVLDLQNNNLTTQLFLNNLVVLTDNNVENGYNLINAILSSENSYSFINEIIPELESIIGKENYAIVEGFVSKFVKNMRNTNTPQLNSCEGIVITVCNETQISMNSAVSFNATYLEDRGLYLIKKK